MGFNWLLVYAYVNQLPVIKLLAHATGYMALLYPITICDLTKLTCSPLSGQEKTLPIQKRQVCYRSVTDLLQTFL